MVIGGLIRDSESEGVSKLPFLGDIPVLGYLFRSTVKSTEKKNLLMVIIPTIIADPSDLKRLHEDRVEEMRDFAEEMATKKKEYMGQIDYRKKSGVLEEMYKVVSKAREERELLESTTFEGSGLDLIGPPETHDIEYDPYEADKLERQNALPSAEPVIDAPPAPMPVPDVPPTAGDKGEEDQDQ